MVNDMEVHNYLSNLSQVSSTLLNYLFKSSLLEWIHTVLVSSVLSSL